MDRFVWLAAAVTAAVALSLLVYFLLRRRITPEERERRRRLAVNSRGRITDGLITDLHVVESPDGRPSQMLHFTYTLSGVTYSASQDVTALLPQIGRDLARVAGPVSVKYLPGNPSNSIVICEEWSGIAGIKCRVAGTHSSKV